MKEEVILVNENDTAVGTMEKMEAHRRALLHRAFSVFIFNTKGELLLQQRAFGKYHSAGLWTNTCCSHPRPGEKTEDAATRRLREEMGLEATLTYKTSFIYKAALEHGLSEHEFDHVYTGVVAAEPILNPEETCNYRWQDLAEVRQEIKLHPEQFTVWFKIAMEKLF